MEAEFAILMIDILSAIGLGSVYSSLAKKDIKRFSNMLDVTPLILFVIQAYTGPLNELANEVTLLFYGIFASNISGFIFAILFDPLKKLIKTIR